ncbi:hypothetical protein E2320_006244 [Naja naja]|nr:hypothetical protein E2320_006244 [Naja naja]
MFSHSHPSAGSLRSGVAGLKGLPGFQGSFGLHNPTGVCLLFELHNAAGPKQWWVGPEPKCVVRGNDTPFPPNTLHCKLRLLCDSYILDVAKMLHPHKEGNICDSEVSLRLPQMENIQGGTVHTFTEKYLGTWPFCLLEW